MGRDYEKEKLQNILSKCKERLLEYPEHLTEHKKIKQQIKDLKKKVGDYK